MSRPGRRASRPAEDARAADERASAYAVALASARKVRRRDLALVEQYLGQIRMIASAQARSDAGRGGAER